MVQRTDKPQCCGCNACGDICSHNAISYVTDEEGFWYPKIERNMQRDIEVTQALIDDGWVVLRFWGNQIKKQLSDCADQIEKAVNSR